VPSFRGGAELSLERGAGVQGSGSGARSAPAARRAIARSGHWSIVTFFRGSGTWIFAVITLG